MKYADTFSSTSNQPVSLEVEIPDPLQNECGQIVIDPGSKYGSITVHITVTPEMNAAGVTRIDPCSPYIETAHPGGVIGVPVSTNKGKTLLRTDSRPQLVALVENGRAINKAIQNARTAYWDAERAEYRARVEQPLIGVMLAREAELIASIPADCVRLQTREQSDGDGGFYTLFFYRGTGIAWDTPGLERDYAAAIRPGAQSAFEVRCVAYLPLETAERLYEECEDRTAQQQAEAQALKRELLETPIPENVMKVYDRYRGNAERAWEQEDESAWALINHWEPYIEAQRGLHPEKIAQLLNESAREEQAQYIGKGEC